MTTTNYAYTFMDDVFTEEEINLINDIGEALPMSDGTVDDADGAKVLTTSLRKNKNSWIGLNENTLFIYNKLSSAVDFLNTNYYQFDVRGFAESFQYTVYEDDDNHYDWHIDKLTYGSQPDRTRKLTAITMLSDPDSYEGGDLQIMTSTEPTILERKKGRVYVLPSYVLHRVTPVTKGRRITLVSWAVGNQFR